MQNPQQRNICRREEKGFSTQVPPYYIKCSIWRGEARNDEFGGDFFFFFFNLEDCDFVRLCTCNYVHGAKHPGRLGSGAASERGRPLGAQVAPERGTQSG